MLDCFVPHRIDLSQHENMGAKKSKTHKRTDAHATPRLPQLDRELVGMRIDRRLAKVIKSLAELHDCTIGEFVEEMVVSALEGRSLLAGDDGQMTPTIRKKVRNLLDVFDVPYTAADLKAARVSRHLATKDKGRK